MASFIRRIFRRKKPAPLVCSVTLDDHGNPLADDPHHHHTGACFIEIEALAIIELFQSQGCTSCPPAVPGIQKAATESPNRILLTYDVTLFDHLGWKDTFAKTAWDQRQRAYIRHWKRNTLFTPHVVVNGITDTSGAKGPDEVHHAVQRAREDLHLPFHIYLDANDTEIRIDSDAPAPGAPTGPAPAYGAPSAATYGDGMDMLYNGGGGGGQPQHQTVAAPTPVHDIYVAVYQAGDQTVKIAKGPNKGKKFTHRNQVIDLIKIGQWQGGDLTVPLPSPKTSMQHGTEAVAFVQAGVGGPIIAATKI